MRLPHTADCLPLSSLFVPRCLLRPSLLCGPAVYFSTSVSARTRALLLSNWIRTTIFGRDVSKQ